MEDKRAGSSRKLAIMFAVGAILLAIIAFGLYSLSGGGGSSKPKPPKISLLPNTPPPPPPPPKEEKKPEPPKEQKEVKIEQPDVKQPPAPDTTLKMEGTAGDGQSLFSSGKVTNEDLTRLRDNNAGGGGRGQLNPFNTYAASIKNELQRILSRRSDLKRRQYRVELDLWVGDDGRVRRFELLGTTEDGDTDKAIRDALASLPAFSEPPPPKMPQPVKLRIVAGGRV